jgi:hypothetical protein
VYKRAPGTTKTICSVKESSLALLALLSAVHFTFLGMHG